LTLLKEAALFCKTFIFFDNIMHCHIPEDHNLIAHCCWNVILFSEFKVAIYII
jgi:hypothetical protein